MSCKSSLLALSSIAIAVGALAAVQVVRRSASKPKKPALCVDDCEGEAVPPLIREELLSRVKSFFGEEGLEKLQNSFVVVSTSVVSTMCIASFNPLAGGGSGWCG